MSNRYLTNHKKNTEIHVEYNTVDKNTYECISNCILNGHLLILSNPDELLIDAVYSLLSFKHRNVIKQLLSFKDKNYS